MWAGQMRSGCYQNGGFITVVGFGVSTSGTENEKQ